MRKSAVIFTAALCACAAALTGCNPDPARRDAAAGAGDAEAAAAEAPPGELATGGAATAAIYAVDKARSMLTFTVSQASSSHSGGWTEFTGTVAVPGGDFAAAKLRVDIDMNSTFGDDGDSTEKLKSDWFLDVANHPSAAFESTKIAKTGAGYDISGNLTLRGVTKNLTFPAAVTMENGTLTAEATLSLDGTVFGVAHDGPAGAAPQDDVVMALYIVAAAS